MDQPARREGIAARARLAPGPRHPSPGPHFLLPAQCNPAGGISLLHFSSDRSGRALPVILALRSPDFPHGRPFGLPTRLSVFLAVSIVQERQGRCQAGFGTDHVSSASRARPLTAPPRSPRRLSPPAAGPSAASPPAPGRPGRSGPVSEATAPCPGGWSGP